MNEVTKAELPKQSYLNCILQPRGFGLALRTKYRINVCQGRRGQEPFLPSVTHWTCWTKVVPTIRSQTFRCICRYMYFKTHRSVHPHICASIHVSACTCVRTVRDSIFFKMTMECSNEAINFSNLQIMSPLPQLGSGCVAGALVWILTRLWQFPKWQKCSNGCFENRALLLHAFQPSSGMVTTLFSTSDWSDT